MNVKEQYFDFWSAFKSYTEKQKMNLNLKQPPSKYYYEKFDKLRGSSRYSLYIRPKDNEINCSLYIPRSKAIFHELKEHRKQIEQKLGVIEWQELPEKQAARLRQFHYVNLDLEDSNTWIPVFKWMSERLISFQATFSPLLK